MTTRYIKCTCYFFTFKAMSAHGTCKWLLLHLSLHLALLQNGCYNVNQSCDDITCTPS